MKRPSAAGKFFGLWLAFLCFVLPVKFASLAVMPEATSYFPEDWFSWLIVTFPAHAWGIVSGMTLLAALILFPMRRKDYKTLPGQTVLLWGIVPLLAVLMGWRNGPWVSYALGQTAHFAGISAFAAAAGLFLLRNPEQKKYLAAGIAAGTLYLGFSGLYQYFIGFADMRDFINQQIAAGYVYRRARTGNAGVKDLAVSAHHNAALYVVVTCSVGRLGTVTLLGHVALIKNRIIKVGTYDLNVIKRTVVKRHKGITRIKSRRIASAGHGKSVTVKGVTI